MPAKAKSKANKDEVITGRVSGAIYRRLDALAEATDRSKSFLVSEAIESYVSLQEWQIEAIKEGMRQADAGEFADPAEIDAILRRARAKR